MARRWKVTCYWEEKGDKRSMGRRKEVLGYGEEKKGKERLRGGKM